MALKKPESIANSSFKSQKWDEITSGNNFTESDVPTISLLCQWYQIIEQCMDDVSVGDGVQVAFQNDMGDLKALPQISTMKQASAEIRALNKQLGINDSHEEVTKPKETKLYVIQNRRTSRQSKATG